MATINPYLHFDGKAEEAFQFYQSIFGGEADFRYYRDAPAENKFTAEEGNLVMHVSLPISKGFTLMASDIVPSMGHKLVVGNNAFVSIDASSKAEAEKLYNGLSAGGQVFMPIASTFWGAYFGMFRDKFGVQWMVTFDENRK